MAGADGLRADGLRADGLRADGLRADGWSPAQARCARLGPDVYGGPRVGGVLEEMRIRTKRMEADHQRAETALVRRADDFGTMLECVLPELNFLDGSIEFIVVPNRAQGEPSNQLQIVVNSLAAEGVPFGLAGGHVVFPSYDRPDAISWGGKPRDIAGDVRMLHCNNDCLLQRIVARYLAFWMQNDR